MKLNCIQKKILEDKINMHIVEALFDRCNIKNLSTRVPATKKSINKRLKKLSSANLIEFNKDKTAASLAYEWKLINKYNLKKINESDVFTNDVETLNLTLNENAEFILFYGFTEILNNAIDHSNGQIVDIGIKDCICGYYIYICDDGIGIFKKIKKALRLKNEEVAVMRLSIGKLTTDKKRHTGQGIFFTSRLMDHFTVYSGENFYTHDYDRDKDYLSLANPKEIGDNKGTNVFMSFRKESNTNPNKVFEEYTTSDDSHAFQKTIVPIKLASYTINDMLVSRSQAKMVLAGLDEFEEIIFDFSGVMRIGQGFADEIFRVYQSKHPDKKLKWINANKRHIEKFLLQAVYESAKS